MEKLHPLKRWRRTRRPAPWRQIDLAEAANVPRWTVAYLEVGRPVAAEHGQKLEGFTGLRLARRRARSGGA